MIAVSGVVALALALAALVPPDGPGPRVRDRFGGARPGAATDCLSSAECTGAHDQTAGTQQPAVDRWLDVDKAQHFAMAYGSAVVGYSVLRAAEVGHGDARTAALAGSFALGLGKELADRARGGAFSYRDLTWDVLGTLAAWGLLALNR